MVSLTNPLRVAISGLCLLLCMFATFYFLVVWKTGIIYTHLFYVPIVLVSLWWRRKGIIIVFSLVLFLLICNLFFAPDVSIVDNLLRSAIFLFISILTSNMFERIREERLEKERLYSVLNSMTSFVVIEDEDYTVQFMNEPLKNVFGDQVGKKCYEVFIGRNEPCPVCPIAEIIRKGKEEFKYTPMVKGRTFESYATPFKNPDGSVSVLEVLNDITERKRAEEKLRLFSQSVDSSIDGIAMGNPEDKITYVNEAFVRMFGYSRKELIGKPIPFIYPEDQIPKLEEALKATKEGGWTGELVGKRKNGELFPMAISSSRVVDDKGKIVAHMAVHRDITERKKAEDALRDSEELYRTLVHTSPDAIIMGDLTGKIIHVNPQAVKMTRFEDEEEMIGLNPFDYTIPKDHERAMNNLTKTLKTGITRNAEYTLIRKDGTQYPAELSNALIRDAKGKPQAFLSVIREITERKKMEEKLKEYTEHLEEKVEERTKELKEAQERLVRSERLAAVGEAAAMVGHDLRNPLQSIEIAAYYLNNELPRITPSTPIPQKAKEMLQVIKDSVDHADKIITDLHDFSATKKPILNKTDVNAIVKDALSQVEAPENVELITELGHLPRIEADKDMIKRVFLNLAVNGIQAMENGGTLKVSTKKTKGFVEVSFKDTGRGMSKENMKKLFSPFFTTRAIGMGMGLPICKKFVDAHGGGIEVESEEGKGSTFTVKLPIQQENGGRT